MSKQDRERLLKIFERNKLARKARNAKPARKFRFRAIILSLLALLGASIALPGQFNALIESLISLRSRTVELWLKPERWEGIFHGSPEGYVDFASMNLDQGSDMFFEVFYVSPEIGFDGEIVSAGFCNRGRLHTNFLLRGRQNLLHPDELDLEVYDFVGGHEVIFGEITAILASPVIEIRGWIIEGSVRLALDPSIQNIPVSRLCFEAVP